MRERLEHSQALPALPRLLVRVLRLLEAVVLGEPLRVRQIHLRRVRWVLLDELHRVRPHVELEVEREQSLDVAELQQHLTRVRVVLVPLEVLKARL